VARALGSRVPLWCTLNEPMVLVVGGYLGKFMPPAVFAPTLAAQACANLLRAHVAAYDILRAEIPGAQVGFAHNMIDFRPDRAWHPLERAACWAFDRFYNRSWLDAVTGRKPAFSVPGLIPAAAPVPEARGRRTVDFIGVNYYTKAYLQWRPRDAALTLKEAPLGVSFARRAEETTDMGWAIHPEGLKRILRRVGRYGLPIHVTENGIADREDRLRPRYLREHLLQVADAIADGVDIRGYYYWSLLDNFEWIKGFGPRFGLFSVDYSTFERTATGSARLLRDLIAAHRGGAPKRARIAAVGV
jgi:beta-glucosidase